VRDYQDLGLPEVGLSLDNPSLEIVPTTFCWCYLFTILQFHIQDVVHRYDLLLRMSHVAWFVSVCAGHTGELYKKGEPIDTPFGG